MAEVDRHVESSRFPYLPLRVLVAGRAFQGEALLDTGFDGGVVIPAGTVPTGTPPDDFAVWSLADGSRVRAATFRATVRIGELEPFRVLVTVLGNEMLIGREVCDRFRIVLDHGSTITAEP